MALMSLKAGENNKQRLVCRFCDFSVSHEVDLSTNGVRRIYVSPNKSKGFKHNDTKFQCFLKSEEKLKEIARWQHSDHLTRQYLDWLINNPNEKRNFQCFLNNRDNWTEKIDLFHHPTPAWSTMIAVLNQYISSQVIQ